MNRKKKWTIKKKERQIRQNPTLIKDSLIPLRGLCIQKRAAEPLKMEDQYKIGTTCEQWLQHLKGQRSLGEINLYAVFCNKQI